MATWISDDEQTKVEVVKLLGIGDHICIKRRAVNGWITVATVGSVDALKNHVDLATLNEQTPADAWKDDAFTCSFPKDNLSCPRTSK